MRPSPALLVATCASVVLVRGAVGCGEGGTPALDATADVGSDGGAPTAKPDAKPTDARPETGPTPTAPTGWLPVPGYAACPLSYPAAGTALPGLKWVDCPSVPETSGLRCRMVDFSWSAPEAILRNDSAFSSVKATRTLDGRVLLAYAQRYPGYTVWSHAEPDGEVLSSVSAPLDANCGVTVAPSEGAHALYRGESSGGQDSALVGTLDRSAPRLAASGLGLAELYGAADGFVSMTDSKIELRSWTDGSVRKVLSDGAKGQLRHVVSSGDTVVFADTQGSGGSIYISGLSRPTEVFAAPSADYTTGVGDLGTDGVNWVWNEGGNGWLLGERADVKLVTAPFTVSPAAAQATKRTVWSGTMNGRNVRTVDEPYIVGCGYAAHYAATGTPAGEVDKGGYLVTRLADAKAYFLRATPAAGLTLSFGRVLAISCSEVFVLTALRYDATHTRTTVTRIDLSTLPEIALPLLPITKL